MKPCPYCRIRIGWRLLLAGLVGNFLGAIAYRALSASGWKWTLGLWPVAMGLFCVLVASSMVAFSVWLDRRTMALYARVSVHLSEAGKIADAALPKLEAFKSGKDA